MLKRDLSTEMAEKKEERHEKIEMREELNSERAKKTRQELIKKLKERKGDHLSSSLQIAIHPQVKRDLVQCQ